MINKLTREEALTLLNDSSRFKHSLRVGKMMKHLAQHLGEDVVEWELVGLLHDLDYDQTISDRQMHGIIAGEMLHGKLSDTAINAIKSHDYRTSTQPDSKLAHLLISVDALDHLLSILEEQNRPITVNTIKNILNDWTMEKPWLKDYIIASENQHLLLDSFLEICLNSLNINAKLL